MLKNLNRFILTFSSVFLFLIFINVFAFEIKPTSEFYINDFANVLSSETKKYILDNSATLCEKTKAQVVVVTVNSLDGKDLDDFSLELFRDWKIGDKDLNNGLLILLSINDRKVKVEVGNGLEGRINDSKAGRFLDEYSVPFFKNDDWDTGIKNLYSALMSEVYSEYNLEMPTEVSSVVSQCQDAAEESNDGVALGIAVLILVVIFGGIVPFFRRKRHPELIDDNDFNDNNFGGGFWGGFGGGNDSGGGFGGFSGGGGSAGGGGASRSF